MHTEYDMSNALLNVDIKHFSTNNTGHHTNNQCVNCLKDKGISIHTNGALQMDSMDIPSLNDAVFWQIAYSGDQY